MTAPILRKVLEATGYVADGIPAQGVLIDDDARRGRRGRFFEPDALWRGQSSLTVYFKSAEAEPSDELVASWRQEVWNEGFAPLLWVVSPDRVDLYNGFGRPLPSADAARNRLATFEAIESSLEQLDALAGRPPWKRVSSGSRPRASIEKLRSTSSCSRTSPPWSETSSPPTSAEPRHRR
jgi:hypothetical protein